ncbi:MAG: C40 family peptidase [Fibrella sp.]|nr:C40 family peptidase [Armatimonadota bacterium]
MPLSFIERPRRSALDKVLMVLWWATLASFAATMVLPLRSGALRAGMVLAGILLWLAGTYLCRRRRSLLAIGLLVPVLVTLFVLSPDRSVDSNRLRGAYVESLRSLEGTNYVWGGETRLGIDCSGLVRGAMVEANLREGIRTGNPRLVRTAATLWWFDASAKALGENYRGLTTPIADAKSLNEADYSALHPGDIAVTESGIHTLAYLGDKTWIQADPVPMRVVRTTAPATGGWFVQGVRLLRWTEFGEAEPAQVASAKTHIQPRIP